MHKDRLVLVLLLAGFALMGAKCNAVGGGSDEEKNLPSRALAASPLLRTYYDTLSTPKGMTDIKIPEDKDDLKKHGPLVVKFDMGGSAVITDVRCRLRIAGPLGTEASKTELICRIQAPGGTLSPWKVVDWNDSDVFDPQVEVAFLNEFDGLVSDGTWEIQLQDALDDGDGRCVFRNGTLRLNLGETTPGGAANDSDTISLTAAVFNTVPELFSQRDKADWGEFGMQAMLRIPFTMTNSFFVRGYALTFSLLVYEGNDPLSDVYWMLIAPSGTWVMYSLDGLVAEEFEDTANRRKVLTFVVGQSTASGLPEAFPFRGEPSAGTWTLCLMDHVIDNNVCFLSKDAAMTTVLVPDSPPTLALSGVS